MDRAVLKFRREGIEVEVAGLNEVSMTIMGNLAAHNDSKGHGKGFRSLNACCAGV